METLSNLRPLLVRVLASLVAQKVCGPDEDVHGRDSASNSHQYSQLYSPTAPL